MKKTNLVIGAGVTGLAAGMCSGMPVYEATENPGGICRSYYIRPGSNEILTAMPKDGDAYHFENGGGHWIFGGDPSVMEFLDKIAPVCRYFRRSSVFFHDKGIYVPYPLQNNLRFLNGILSQEQIASAVFEMSRTNGSFATMQEWLLASFGQTLGNLFFLPFHALYTAGLHERIAPQDAYKSPVDLSMVLKGALSEAPAVGYNTSFVYPQDGLDVITSRMAAHCNVQYGKKMVSIDTSEKVVHFEDGSNIGYNTIISTLPLTHMVKMANIKIDVAADPYTSVLVLNIGAVRGEKCPDDHWLYNFNTKSGFHRVGFYSNVDRSFLPISSRKSGERVSIYVERAYPGGMCPGMQEIEEYKRSVAAELVSWGFVSQIEVIDENWIDVAYTWSWPGSSWARTAMEKLKNERIFQVGRYGRWTFQGVADSIRDGFIVGSSLSANH